MVDLDVPSLGPAEFFQGLPGMPRRAPTRRCAVCRRTLGRALRQTKCLLSSCTGLGRTALEIRYLLQQATDRGFIWQHGFEGDDIESADDGFRHALPGHRPQIFIDRIRLNL